MTYEEQLEGCCTMLKMPRYPVVEGAVPLVWQVRRSLTNEFHTADTLREAVAMAYADCPEENADLF